MEAIKFSWLSWQGKEILSQTKKALQRDSEVDKSVPGTKTDPTAWHLWVGFQ